MASDPTDATVRLSDLRRAKAADVSLENLLNALTGKLQDCARLAVFEYEAGSEGHADLALAFHDLGLVERDSFRLLLDHLRRHLDELPVQTRLSASASPAALRWASHDPHGADRRQRAPRPTPRLGRWPPTRTSRSSPGSESAARSPAGSPCSPLT